MVAILPGMKRLRTARRILNSVASGLDLQLTAGA